MRAFVPCFLAGDKHRRDVHHHQRHSLCGGLRQGQGTTKNSWGRSGQASVLCATCMLRETKRHSLFGASFYFGTLVCSPENRRLLLVGDKQRQYVRFSCPGSIGFPRPTRRPRSYSISPLCSKTPSLACRLTPSPRFLTRDNPQQPRSRLCREFHERSTEAFSAHVQARRSFPPIT